MDPDWLPFHPNPSRPRFVPPAGAVDAHCHIFGPADRFPYAPERKYTPCDAPKEKLFELQRSLGFERSVIVQATCHGTDNRALVDGLQTAGNAAKGIACISQETPDEELEALHEAGVRGIRLNFLRRLVEPAPLDQQLRLIQRIQPLGWHVVLYFEAADLPDLWNFIAGLTLPVVVDHLGRPDVSQPVGGPEFGLYHKLLKECPNIYTKVTCPDRLTRLGPPCYGDVVPFARHLVEHFPERVLWGTDWPHPNLKSHMPDDGQLVDLIPAIAPTEEARRKLLVENPMRLYWPEEVGQ